MKRTKKRRERKGTLKRQHRRQGGGGESVITVAVAPSYGENTVRQIWTVSKPSANGIDDDFTDFVHAITDGDAERQKIADKTSQYVVHIADKPSVAALKSETPPTLLCDEAASAAAASTSTMPQQPQQQQQQQQLEQLEQQAYY